ncbi:MAG TPA: 1,4-alpha-glucan branching protein domain-containing protein [Mycobacteriales bacterium]|nr:1,4-alpha-glucan branching protein domain-containing protein [Mycobacteriales bacterium]
MTEPVGTFCLVLHTHLPWLAHHGAWPVGEEWLHQAWAGAYLPVVDVLSRLAEEGRRELLTLGVTPVLAAQLDDAYCLREFHTWLGFWQARAEGLAQRGDAASRELAAYEFRAARDAQEAFEARWQHGASPLLRGLADAGVVELLGGPATHPFQPLLDERFVHGCLAVGLDDARLRVGAAPEGIWAPECGYRPGLETVYAAAGVRRFLVDGPTLHGSTADAWTVGSSDVVVFGRDLDVTYRVWSPRRGYPGGRHYRDFHTVDHPSGFRPARVTSSRMPPHEKAPYDVAAARAAVAHDAEDFVRVVRARLDDWARQRGRPGLVVAAYDTELFGHWWHEGPLFLAQVLRLLPGAGVRVTTLRGAVEAGHVAGPRELPPGSWGSGKDWRVWDGAQVRDLVEENARVVERLLDVVDKTVSPGTPRRPDLDQLAREAMFAVSSDWAFMVTKDSAAAYARHRAHQHVQRFDRLADLVAAGRPADRLAAALRAVDGPFGHLDARVLAYPQVAVTGLVGQPGPLPP